MRTIIRSVSEYDAPELATVQTSVEERDSFARKNRAPVLGSFADVWESRQTSEIIMDELKKDAEEEEEEDMPRTPSDASSAAHPQLITCHNPYSLTEPMMNIYVCQCEDCLNTSRPVSQEYNVEVSQP
eukprot:102363_1